VLAGMPSLFLQERFRCKRKNWCLTAYPARAIGLYYGSRIDTKIAIGLSGMEIEYVLKDSAKWGRY
jgi:hypothetical protein